MITFINIYIIIGLIIALPLARIYFIKWRDTPNELNVVLPLKILNRIIDSFIFLIAYSIYVFLYPLAIIELIIDLLKKKGVKNGKLL